MSPQLASVAGFPEAASPPPATTGFSSFVASPANHAISTTPAVPVLGAVAVAATAATAGSAEATFGAIAPVSPPPTEPLPISTGVPVMAPPSERVGIPVDLPAPVRPAPALAAAIQAPEPAGSAGPAPGARLAPDVRTTCPLLTVRGRPGVVFSYANTDHECQAGSRPSRVDPAHQVTFCLTGGYSECQRYQALAARVGKAR